MAPKTAMTPLVIVPVIIKSRITRMGTQLVGKRNRFKVSLNHLNGFF